MLFFIVLKISEDERMQKRSILMYIIFCKYNTNYFCINMKIKGNIRILTHFNYIFAFDVKGVEFCQSIVYDKKVLTNCIFK